TTAQMVGIPFLTTSYSGDGLTSLGNKIFQGCPTDRKLGEGLGRWVVSQGNFKVGVVYPLNSYGRTLTEAFTEEVKRAGGIIIAEEGYYPGTSDLTPYLLNLRMRGWRFLFDEFLKNQYDLQGFIQWRDTFFHPKPYQLAAETLNSGSIKLRLSSSLLDSLWQIALKEKITGWGKSDVMSSGSEEATPVIEDTLSIPTTVYQAVLLIIEPGMVGMVAPQWARVNFSAMLVGNEFWGDPENLITNARYLEGMVFASSSPINVDWEKVDGDEVWGEIGSDPELQKAFLEGERAAAMVIFSKERSHTRDDFTSVLGMIWGLETLSGQVKLLKAERINRSVFLYRVRNGKIVPEILE
ncbi:MAG: ABC transporter substrate-binding protein, partial [bacterium]